MWEVFNGFNDDASKPAAPGKMPRQLHEFYRKCVTSQAAKLNAAELLSGWSILIYFAVRSVRFLCIFIKFFTSFLFCFFFLQNPGCLREERQNR